MKPWKVTLLILLALAVAAAGYGSILVRRGFIALAKPSAVEEFAATTARKVAVPSEYRQLRNPIPPSAETIRAGMEHFSDHCATCHANDGGGQTFFGKGLYPKPPDLRAAGTQNKSDGELYYTIQNGVRLSAIPASRGERLSRRELSSPAKLDRAGVSQTHLLQPSRQRRTLRGLGTAKALFRRGSRGLQIAAQIIEPAQRPSTLARQMRQLPHSGREPLQPRLHLSERRAVGPL
jgi:mono/diheme cytochrome c family protein